MLSEIVLNKYFDKPTPTTINLYKLTFQPTLTATLRKATTLKTSSQKKNFVAIKLFNLN